MKTFFSVGARILLFVAGGIPNTGTTNNTELVDLSGNGLSCQAPASLPKPTWGPSGMVSAEGKPLSCGGKDYEVECIEYSPGSDSWEYVESLSFDRRRSATTKLGDGFKYWIAGGMSYRGATEIYGEGAMVTDGIPGSGYGYIPCAVALNESEVLYASVKSYFYHVQEDLVVETASQVCQRFVYIKLSSYHLC